MADGPDPLGKRALFWAPAQRREDEPGDEPPPPVAGRRALFSSTTGAGPGLVGAPIPGHGATVTGPAVTADPGLHRAAGLGEVRADAAAEARDPSGADPRAQSSGGGLFALVDVDCSSCRARRRVDLVEYTGLHLPFFLWRPGRGYTRWMRCPSCRRRTWISASWASWPR